MSARNAVVPMIKPTVAVAVLNPWCQIYQQSHTVPRRSNADGGGFGSFAASFSAGTGDMIDRLRLSRYFKGCGLDWRHRVRVIDRRYQTWTTNKGFAHRVLHYHRISILYDERWEFGYGVR
jgi:hypothetical protein